MIVWINGPFGIGKTQTAFELQRLVRGSILFDPERVGFFLRDVFPPELRGPDFQDYPLWRKMVSGILEYLQSDRTRLVIVPMTVVSKEYYREIVGPLQENGIAVRNFTLIASKETIQSRLRRRLDGKSWNFRQIDRCLEGLADPIFCDYVDTDKLNLYEAVDAIIEQLNVQPRPLPKSEVRRFLRRLRVTISHVRR